MGLAEGHDSQCTLLRHHCRRSVGGQRKAARIDSDDLIVAVIQVEHAQAARLARKVAADPRQRHSTIKQPVPQRGQPSEAAGPSRRDRPGRRSKQRRITVHRKGGAVQAVGRNGGDSALAITIRDKRVFAPRRYEHQ